MNDWKWQTVVDWLLHCGRKILGPLWLFQILVLKITFISEFFPADTWAICLETGWLTLILCCFLKSANYCICHSLMEKFALNCSKPFNFEPVSKHEMHWKFESVHFQALKCWKFVIMYNDHWKVLGFHCRIHICEKWFFFLI